MEALARGSVPSWHEGDSVLACDGCQPGPGGRAVLFWVQRPGDLITGRKPEVPLGTQPWKLTLKRRKFSYTLDKIGMGFENLICSVNIAQENEKLCKHNNFSFVSYS